MFFFFLFFFHYEGTRTLQRKAGSKTKQQTKQTKKTRTTLPSSAAWEQIRLHCYHPTLRLDFYHGPSEYGLLEFPLRAKEEQKEQKT
jgi:hypothetical protein